MLKRLAGNTVLNIASYVVRIAVSFVLTPILIGRLGRESYGVWVLGNSLVIAGALSILDLGISGAVVRFVAAAAARDDRREVSSVINGALLAYFIIGIVACSVVHAIRIYWFVRVFAVPPSQAPAANALLAILAWQLLLTFPAIALAGTIEGLQRYDLLRVLDIGQSLVFAVFAGIIVSVSPNVVWLGWLLFGLSAARSATAFVLLRKVCATWSISAGTSAATLRKIFVFSAQLLGVRVNALVYNNIDKMIIGILLSSTVLADYDVVYRLYALGLVSLSFVSQLVVPAASDLDARGDTERLTRLKFWATKMTVAICCPVAVTTMILAEPILRYWIGPAFVQNVLAVRLFVGYLVLWALVPVGYNILIGTGRVFQLLWVQIPTTILNLALSILLAPTLGIVGVIIGTVVGNAVAFCFYVPMFFGTTAAELGRFFRNVIARSYIWVAVSGVALAGLVWRRPPQSLAETGVMWACSIGLFWSLYLLFGTDDDERRALNGLTGGRLARVPVLGGWFLRRAAMSG
jgi:O-antigen/teichoic acid export membrane protein